MKKFLLFLLITTFSIIIKAQEDCISALQICGNSDLAYSPSGIGNVNESLGGCLNSSGEHNSIWYKITIGSSGTLTFNIVPSDPDADYDWAVYGPATSCANRGNPIRCNGATVIGVGASTGLNMTSTILNAAGGSTTPYCRYLDVVAGQTYYLYIDNWISSTSSTMAPFSLTWGGTATLASPFTDPAMTPNPFVPPGDPGPTVNDPREITVCSNPMNFDFATLAGPILNGNQNFVITFHRLPNEALTGINPIINYEILDFTKTYYYSINYQDPQNPQNPINSCRQIGTFKFKDGTVRPTNATLSSCNNDGQGFAIFNLTDANVIGVGSYTKKYYPSLGDLSAGTNEILNPVSYNSAAGDVYVKVIAPTGCFGIAKISLSFKPEMIAFDGTLRSCAIETNPSTALFDLSNVSITTMFVASKKYYPSYQDAQNDTNEITNPTTFIAPSGEVYVKVYNSSDCFAIAKIVLIVIPPVHSTILKDKVICIESQTTLDAGPGFSKYEWSTGATTQGISGVGVGTYWVKLTTGQCVAVQTVKVYPAENPVIASVEIGHKSFKINVIGGVAPYKYSLDGTIWQASNEFVNISRGEHKIYVKDSSDCDPVIVTVTVPNIVNVLTTNGDGINDGIDYSALATKKNLTFNVFDKYGSKIFEASKMNGYKWDGTIAGRKLPTDTYWFTLSWNENDRTNTQFIYNSWIMIKNR